MAQPPPSFFPILLLLSFLLHPGGATVERQPLSLAPLPPLPESDDPAWIFGSGSRTSALTELRLHHRDSLHLLTAANSTPESLFLLRLERDAARAASIEDIAAGRRPGSASGGFSSAVVSGLAQGSGEYFTRIAIGTPPTSGFMVLDTGSDVIWVQCAPCLRCYSQIDPIFNPNSSGSYSAVPCGAPLCRRLDAGGCAKGKRPTCLYRVVYGDGSISAGDFATETLTFSGGAQVAGVGFGCGHANAGLFVGAAGLLGLGQGKLSFPSQAGDRIGRRFSYCLVDRTSAAAPGRRRNSSTLIFGASAAPPGAGAAVFTPMVANPQVDTFYYVELTGISVGGERVAGVREDDLRLDRETGKGGVIVDSGTSVTRLAQPAYAALRDAFRAGAEGLRAARSFSLFDTCYDLSGMTEVKVPTVVLHFKEAGGGDGASDLPLPAENYLIPVTTDPVFCFAFAGSGGAISIIGNIQQQGFRVVFDGAGSRVGFIPNSC